MYADNVVRQPLIIIQNPKPKRHNENRSNRGSRRHCTEKAKRKVRLSGTSAELIEPKGKGERGALGTGAPPFSSSPKSLAAVQGQPLVDFAYRSRSPPGNERLTFHAPRQGRIQALLPGRGVSRRLSVRRLKGGGTIQQPAPSPVEGLPPIPNLKRPPHMRGRDPGQYPNALPHQNRS